MESLAQAPMPRAAPISTSEIASLAREHRPLVDVLAAVCEHLGYLTGSDVAVLLHRDERWRVVTGCGLRPLEWRDLETLPHALSQLSRQQPVLTVGDSENVRPGVVGAPLSRHRSMLLAQVNGAIWVLGRNDPYGQDDVRNLFSAVENEREALAVGFQLVEAADALEQHRLG